jgi:hypothetical protein
VPIGYLVQSCFVARSIRKRGDRGGALCLLELRDQAGTGERQGNHEDRLSYQQWRQLTSVLDDRRTGRPRAPAPLGCLGIVRLESERTLPVRDPRSIVDERDWEETAVTDRDVMGGPQPDEQRTDLLGGAEATTDELGGPEPDEQRTDLLGGAEATTDELGGPEPDEQRTDLLGGADPD